MCIDEDGLELADPAAAREQAVVGARSLMAEQVRKGSLKLHHRIEVEDSDRRPVLSLPFGAAVEVEG